MPILRALCLSLSAVCSMSGWSGVQSGGFRIESQYITGLTRPTAMAFAPDGRLFVTEQGGPVRVISAAGKLLPEPFTTLAQVRGDEERGVLGIAFDPQFTTNGWVYVFSTPGPYTRITRFTASGDTARRGSDHTILEFENVSGNHRGGDLHFGPDGKLYVGIGEAGEPANAQSVETYNGKILRMNKDGSPPPDNPAEFTDTNGVVLRPRGRYRTIWAIGLRNPYRFIFERGTGVMHINDVGGGAFEEVNVGAAGANYGWPACEGNCGNQRTRNPVYAHVRGPDADHGCAITGGAFGEGSSLPAGYANDYFVIDFCRTWVRHLRPDRTFGTLPLTIPASSVDLEVAPDGSLLVLGYATGSISRITFAPR